MMGLKLSVIIPCYHVQNLLENVLEIISVVSSITSNYEIIIINDGNENFPEIAQNDCVKVITHTKNKGKGEALMSGFKIVSGDIITFIDADLQIPAKFIASYYKIMTGERKPDILIGSKRHYNSTVDYPFTRRLISFCYQTVNRIMFGLKVFDTQVGLKMFTKDVVDNILPNLSVKRFAIDLEILVAANEKGYKIIEAPVEIIESFSSTVNLKAVLRVIQDTLAIWYRKKIQKNYKGGENYGRKKGITRE